MIKVNGVKVTKGCTVKFRCGGGAKVSHIEGGDKVYFQGHCWGDSFRYTEDGRIIFGKHKGIGVVSPDFPFDIIEVIPKPFDWKDVEAGMAFEYAHCDNNIYYYVSNCLGSNDYVVVRIGDNILDYAAIHKNELTRAPSEDIT